MLRGNDKKLHVTGRLDEVVGGRLFRPTGYIKRAGPAEAPQGWYDAADTSSLTIVSNNVSQWNDKMGSFNATQGTAGDRPQYNASPRSINGIICLEWSSSDFLASSLPSDDTTFSLFVVGMTDQKSANATMVGSNGGTGGRQLRVSSTAQFVVIGEGGVGGSGPGVFDNAPVYTGVPYILSIVVGASDATYWYCDDRVSLTKLNNTHSFSFTAGRTTRLGLRAAGSEPWDGIMGEIIQYDRTLSQTETIQTISYLAEKWAIAGPNLLRTR